ncbi:hypothetical protein [Flavobacterium soli]|uniref:hypothetical protein n=1 Tax=Flavobacterium soli TaxID=344881 RepID=UPI00146D3E8E|nr:hypothetical protein [Flavobacterium soli]
MQLACIVGPLEHHLSLLVLEFLGGMVGRTRYPILILGYGPAERVYRIVTAVDNSNIVNRTRSVPIPSGIGL